MAKSLLVFKSSSSIMPRYGRYEAGDPRLVRPWIDPDGNIIPRLKSPEGLQELRDYFEENPTLRGYGEDILTFKARQRELKRKSQPAYQKTSRKSTGLAPDDPRRQRKGEDRLIANARLRTSQGAQELREYLQKNPPSPSRLKQFILKPITVCSGFVKKIKTKEVFRTLSSSTIWKKVISFVNIKYW